MRNKASLQNIDNSNLIDYPNGRIKDNTGANDGTPVNEVVYGDIHEAKDKLMRLYGIAYNDLPDNENNGYQLVDALISLASKNDYILDLTLSSGLLSVMVKLSFMKVGESLVCKSLFNLGSQTQIKGSDNVVINFAFIGAFKVGEYVRLIKTTTGVLLVRIADQVSIDAMVSELLYLKAATYSQEIAGILDTVATNPKSNALAFVERVNGGMSSASLASILRNGLYPKEHYQIVAELGASPIRNVGSFSGLEVSSGAVGTNYAVSGDLTIAKSTFANGGLSVIRCTMANAMSSNNYKVNVSIQSQAGMDPDSRLCAPVFIPISTTVFDLGIRETSNAVQNLKIHIDAVQL